MRTKTKLFSLGVSISFLFGMVACGNTTKMSVGNVSEAKQFVQQNYMNFLEGSPKRLIGGADGYCNENGFGTTWDKDNMLYDEDNGMSLMLEVTDDVSRIKASSGDPYVSAEMRSQQLFKYGYFGTYMKPSNVKGTASTFFLYSDSPHDEIDIEFLGNDTTKVQFNYFVNDQGGNEYWYDLGFDASEEYHHYGIYWGENELCWYVDFEPVYRLVGEGCPSSKCRLICNHWAGDTTNSGIMAWMGHVDNSECPSFSRYKDLEIADLEGKAMEILPKVDEYDICPTDDKLQTMPVLFKNCTDYTVYDQNSTSEFDVTYTREDITKDYRCVKFTVDGISGMRWVQFKIKNLHTSDIYPALCRLTVDSTTGSIKFTNIWKNGNIDSSCNLNNNNLEAHYEIQVEEEATMTFRWYGADANTLTMMFDCFGACKTVDGRGQRGGHLHISDFKFGGVQDYIATDDSGNVDELYTKNGMIEDPESDQAEIPSDFTYQSKITFGETDYYQTSSVEGGTRVTYNQPADNPYQQAGYYGSNIFNDSSEIIVVLKNENKRELLMQIKIKTGDTALVSNCEVISNASTGRFTRWSSTAGIPYISIAAGRTCQIKLTLTGAAKYIAFIVSPGTAATGSFIYKGVYTKAATN